MHETRPDSQPEAGKHRFDGMSARRILERAAAVQQRLDNELADSYSLEELEEMAAEAGISAEALRAAIEAHDSDSGLAAGRSRVPGEEPQRRMRAVRGLMPGKWSAAVKGVVLASAGIVGGGGVLLAFPVVAETVLWALLLFLILLTVLIVLGASPF
jgi:hypothetical protein